MTKTPLQRAQEFFSTNADLHAEQVHSLRLSGWSREDAVEEADRRLNLMLERIEAAERGQANE